MQLNTENKKTAFKRTMEILGKFEKKDKRDICRMLTIGNNPYSRTEDASKFLKDLVESEDFPVERKGKVLQRTDLEEVVS